MTELSTRSFISQWQYDHGQGRDTETAIQWRSVDRVAAHLRQREEHHLEDGFDAMDFDTRAAALEALFLRASRREDPSFGRKSPTFARAVPKVRPQSASHARRVAGHHDAGASSSEMAGRQRPQSAKYRSEMPCRDQSSDRVDWNVPTQQKPSKWREMLARSPDFKQLTLRKLELETYKLLYRTLEQQEETDLQPPTQRRRRRNHISNASRSNGYSKAVACGSGLHLARSRRKRQQEHDREMMLGKGRQSSRRSEQEKTKGGGEDKQAIQEKTRRRSKLLQKTASQKLHQVCQSVHQFSKQDKQPGGPCLHRPSSASRTAGGPWIPPGSSSSLAIPSATSDIQVTQDERIAQVLQIFQTHANAHLRISKNVQNQLRKAQQSVKTARASELRKTEQTDKYYPDDKDPVKRARPASASRTVRRTSDGANAAGQQISRGNQENDRVQAADFCELALSVPGLNELPPLSYGSEPLFSESPVTPKLVIPPLKLPPNLWEYQQTDDDTQDEISEPSQQSSRDQPSIALEVVDPVTPSKAAPVHVNAGDMMIFSERKFEALHVDDGMKNQSTSVSHELDRNATLEEGYLAESLVDQASTELSTGDSESSPGELQQEFQREETLRVIPGEDYYSTKSELSGSAKGEVSALNYATSHNGAEGARNTSLLSEVLTDVEISMSSTKEIRSKLPVGVEAPRFHSVEKNVFADNTTEESTSDWSCPEVGKPVKNAEGDFSNSEQPLSVEYNISENPNSRAGTGGMVDNQDNHKTVDLSNSVVGLASDGLKPVGDSSSSECVNTPDEPAILEVEVDTNPTTESLTSTEGEQRNISSVLPGLPEVVLTDGVGDTFSTIFSSNHLLESTRGVSTDHGLDFSTALIEKEYDHMMTNNYDPSPSTNLGCNLLEQSLDSSGPIQLLGNPGAILDTKDLEQLQTTVKFECSDNVVDELQLEGNHPKADHAGEPSNSLRLEHPTMKMVTVDATVSVDTPATEGDEKAFALEVKVDHDPKQTTSAAAKSESRSPKKETSGKTSTPKKKKTPLMLAQSTAKDVKASDTTPLSMQSSLLEARNDNSARSVEDPLQLHQQTVTRSFLHRLSSRKVIGPESIQRKEQVERDDEAGSTETMTTPVTDVETQLEKIAKEREHIDGDSVLTLERECSQTLNNCGSTVEKYPQTTENPVTTTVFATSSPTENVDLATDFTSIFAAVTSTEANLEQTTEEEPNNSKLTSDNQDDSLQEQSQAAWTTTASLIPHTSPDANEAVDQDSSSEHRNAACKIQAQYRCFVRRRLIFDQLRFIVAKQRRQARRKHRPKAKKVKAVDMVTSVSSGLENESPVTAANTKSVDSSLEVQPVTPMPMSSQIGVEMSPEAPSSEAPEPSVADKNFAVRKGSCEYTFELFDGSKEASGEVERTAEAAQAVEDDVGNLPTETETNAKIAGKLDYKLEGPATPEKDADVAKSANDTTSSELLQVEEDISLQECEQPAAGGLLTSMMLAELAFSDDDTEEEPAKPTDTVLVGNTEVQPRWERYVDSSTSKSFYYNPSTNETQWTAPEDRDHAAINSTAARATDVVEVSPGGQLVSAQESMDTWQEFLDEASGQLYYYNSKTGECSWEPPAASGDSPGVVESLQSVATAESAALGVSPWIMYIDPASQAPYYVNTETLVTRWEQPDDFAAAAAEPMAGATGVNEDNTYVIAVDDHAPLEI